MFIRTERLFLRPGWPEDFDELVEILGSDPIVGEPLPGDALDAIRNYLARPRDPRLPLFFIYFRSALGPVLVGGIGLAMQGEDVELDFFIAPRYRGRGYAGEAVRAVLEQAHVLGHRRLIATNFAESDERTGDILERSGFHRTDQTRRRQVAGSAEAVRERLYIAELRREDFLHGAAHSTQAHEAGLAVSN